MIILYVDIVLESCAMRVILGCYWDVVGMSLEGAMPPWGYWDVIGTLLGRYWDVIGTLLGCWCVCVISFDIAVMSRIRALCAITDVIIINNDSNHHP